MAREYTTEDGAVTYRVDVGYELVSVQRDGRTVRPFTWHPRTVGLSYAIHRAETMAKALAEEAHARCDGYCGRSFRSSELHTYHETGDVLRLCRECLPEED